MTQAQSAQQGLPPQMQETLQAQLHDIHLPPPIGWWPPAPGWWLLAGLILCIMVLVYRTAMPRWRQRKYKHYLLTELRHIRQTHSAQGPSVDTVNACSILLKRICLNHLPRATVSSLKGSQWVDFLNAQSSNTPLFCDESQLWLATGRFQTKQPNEQTVEKLLEETEHWITRFLRGHT